MSKTTKTKSYAPQVIADSTDTWVGNALRFATMEEAEQNVSDLAFRWTMVRETRVMESNDPVNYRYVDRKLVEVKPDEPEPEPPLICSICEQPIPVEHGTWTKGHNAQPVNDGRCCGDCNAQVVIPLRLSMLLAKKKG